MVECGGYGSRISSLFRLENAPVITVSTVRRSRLAVTRLHSNTGLIEKTKPLPIEESFAVILHLRQTSSVELWLRGKSVQTDPYRPVGAVCILDLEREPTVYLGRPFDMLHFYVPRTALDELADDQGARRIESLSWPPGILDPTVLHLGKAILPVLEQPDHACKLFVDHVVLALYSHFAYKYGKMRATPSVASGGLASWQVQRVTEILKTHLDGGISLSTLARECKLSMSHFAHAFRRTTGLPPHRWLVIQRIDMAKNLLMRSTLPTAEIALKCGFPDQTSFSRSFKRVVGTSPKAWQRINQI